MLKLEFSLEANKIGHTLRLSVTNDFSKYFDMPFLHSWVTKNTYPCIIDIVEN